eukprot:2347279-Rhodomonas_salina.1
MSFEDAPSLRRPHSGTAWARHHRPKEIANQTIPSETTPEASTSGEYARSARINHPATKWRCARHAGMSGVRT